MNEHKLFKFLSYEYDELTTTVKLRYGFDNDLRFEECFIFLVPKLCAGMPTFKFVGWVEAAAETHPTR